MAERGRLACERTDGYVDVFRAHWGGSATALARVVAGPPRAAFRVADWRVHRRAVARQTVLDTLDYLSTAALYRIGPDGTSAALPLWFGLPGIERADPGLGALVGVRSLPDARHLRQCWRTLKGAVADAVLAGRLSPFGALLTLVVALRSRECSFPSRIQPAAPDVRSLL